MERIVYNLDLDWKFHTGDLKEVVANSHAASYNSCKAGRAVGVPSTVFGDSDWRSVDLPHDYLSESEFGPENLLSHGYRKRCNAWYRKTFNLPKEISGKQLLICFEGTAVNAEFCFNGSIMERSFSAYTETVFDITERAHFDSPNVLAVHINGLETEGWWYEGSGIYRHVKLYAKDKLHIAHNGVFVKPVFVEGSKNDWTVDVKADIENSGFECRTAAIKAVITDKNGVKIATGTSENIEVSPCRTENAGVLLKVSNPDRWDIDTPNLYNITVTVISESEETDSITERTGFRTFRIDADTGFYLNGKNIKIKGTCNHQDHAGVGVAVPDSVQYYRIKRLKEMGSNAYRCSHNLPTKEVLDACDELGMIVMDENRRFESRREVLDYIDIMVKRDRNHPSVIFYSLFNEEPLQNTEEGARIYKRQRQEVLNLDDSRLITGAINGNMEGAGLLMDVTGINYNIGALEAMHEKHPDIPLIGSENNSAVSTRGCYFSRENGQNVLDNYGGEVVPWGQNIFYTWKFVTEHAWYPGIFIWTGFDYRGEPTPFTWPSVSSQFGIMDTCGFAKESFYFNKACFTDEPVLHLFPHWNWESGRKIKVAVATNCDECELFLNGVSLGKKPSGAIHRTEWEVEFAPGTISAYGYKNGECVVKDEHTTTGTPIKIVLFPDRTYIKNDGHDTVVLNCAVADSEGRLVPTADNHLKFTVEGDAFVRGVGNGDPNSHEPDIADERSLYCGLCQALIMSKPGAGSAKVTVTGEGLEPAEICFEVKNVDQPNYIYSVKSSVISSFTMSKVFDERPDPLMAISDNDMNSFTPVYFTVDTFQDDFRNGWRIYRAVSPIPDVPHITVSFQRINSYEAEIYINGELVFESKERIAGTTVKVGYDTKGKRSIELRVLIRAINHNFSMGLGGKISISD